MFREPVALFFAFILLGLSAMLDYVAITGLINGKVYLLSRYSSRPHHYETGVSGILFAASYLIFSVGLVFIVMSLFSKNNGNALMFLFKVAANISCIALIAGFAFSYYYS
jgi:uncharacterized membrane protein